MTLPIPTVYGYCRISVDQRDSVSIESQEETIRSYHQHRFPHLPLVLIHDRGVSGATALLSRPQGQRLQQLAEGDHLIVTKLDRAFRSVADGATVLSHLTRRQIGVHCLDVQVDTTSPTGRLMLHMLMAFAELERERISERRREACAYRRAQGAPMHCVSNPPMGWRVVGQGPGRHYIPDEEDREDCDFLRRMHDEGSGYRKIEEYCIAHNVRRRRTGTVWGKTQICRAVRASRMGYPTQSERYRKWNVVVPQAVQDKLHESQRKRRKRQR